MNTFDPDDPVVRGLLEAGRDELPSQRAVERAAVAVAAAAGTLGATASAAASHAAGAGIASAVAKNAGTSIGLLAFAKWTGIGLSAGLVTLGAIEGARQLSATAEPRAAVVQQTSESKATIAPTEEHRGVVEERSDTHLEEQTTTPLADLGEATEAAQRPNADPLAREVARLDEARSLLDARNPGAALSAVARYEREYPAGRLLPEALVIRMRALEQVGDAEGAKAAAQRIIEISPSSPHATRARAVLDGS